MTTSTNKLTAAEITAVSQHYGKMHGEGSSSRLDFAIRLFEIAATGATIDGKTEYLAFGEAAIAADTRKALRLDLTNKKSVSTQASKLNGFIALAARHSTVRETLFERTITHVDAMVAAKTPPALSMYECVAKVAAAQVDAVDRHLSDEDIADLLPPKAKKVRTRIGDLEDMIEAFDSYSKAWVDGNGSADVAGAKAMIADALAALKAATLEAE